MRVKMRRIEKGVYSWKNGVWVRHEGNKWVLYWGSGAIGFESNTLAACKSFLYRRYPDDFAW